MAKFLSLDQSIASSGYCIMDMQGKVLEHGLIKTSSKLPNEKRLKIIYEKVCDLICFNDVQAVVIEDSYLLTQSRTRGFAGGGNPQTLKTLNQVRGVVMLAAAQYDVELKLYAATTAKKAITGSGRASKDEVIQAVMTKHSNLKLSSDEADAVALAETYLQEVSKNNDKKSK